MKIRLFLLCFCFVPVWLLATKIPYHVEFVGVEDQKILQAIKENSNLESLIDRPPASVNALFFRAKSDERRLLTVLRSYAYHSATLETDIAYEDGLYLVKIFIHMGPPYRLASYAIYHNNCSDTSPLPNCREFHPEDVTLNIGQIADAQSLINAEMSLLVELSRCGYPLALVDKRSVIADMAKHTIDAAVCIEPGPLAKFGHTSLFGLKSVDARFIERQIRWKEGDIFNADLINETQSRLLKTDLFSAVLISYSEEVGSENELPMKIRLTEAKHRSISIGAYYATVDGPGGSICWTHRNLRNMGEFLSVEMNGSKRFIGGNVTYRKPAFFHVDQSWSLIGDVSREDIIPYLAFSYIGSSRIDRQVGNRLNLSVGLSGEFLSVHESANDGRFFDLSLPIFIKYSTIEAPLDPIKGYTLSYLASPYQSMNYGSVRYFKQRLIINGYIPLKDENKIILAVHAEIGSISGASQKFIPIPRLFLGGSEDDLRGYAYKTVSPLGRRDARGDKDSPLGGRSAIFTTAELRFRLTKSIGLVSFADFGTVTRDECPSIQAKWYRSVGGGIRYYSFFGPIRLDVGFPLDPRKNIDSWGKIYASIGQSF